MLADMSHRLLCSSSSPNNCFYVKIKTARKSLGVGAPISVMAKIDDIEPDISLLSGIVGAISIDQSFDFVNVSNVPIHGYPWRRCSLDKLMILSLTWVDIS